jgi:hypothetical protein
MKKRKTDRVISSGAAGDVVVQMESDIDLGEVLDTRIYLTGEWWIAGCQREEFCRKLGHLIEEYRI